MPTYNKICEACKKDFIAGRKDKQFCSVGCIKKELYKKIEPKKLICIFCNAEFFSKKQSSKYCSKTCINKGAKSHPDVQLICKECNNPFNVKYVHRDKLFCSRSCATTHQNRKMFADDIVKTKISETKKAQYASGEILHPFSGRAHTEETKKKISKIRIDNDLSKGANNPMYGKSHSEETKQKISNTRIKKIMNGDYSQWFKKGTLFSIKLRREITFRSSWEEIAYKFLETCKDVKEYSPEPFSIPYKYFSARRLYLPDILITYYDGRQKLIEIKPISLITADINQSKFKAARQYCEEKGIIFEVWSEQKIEELKKLLDLECATI